jgi:hypothetical protein
MASFKAFAPLLIVLVTCDGPAAQDLRELARGHAKRHPGEPMLQTASPAHYQPKTIEELTRAAEVVVQATLVQARSYVTPDADRVLTDYLIVTPKVLAGRSPVLTPSKAGTAPALILTTYGGEVVLEDVTVRGLGTNREPITSGAQYLLFLMPSRGGQAGQYEICYGGIFAIVGGSARALIRERNRVFKDAVDAPLQSLLDRIQAAAPVR